MKKVLFVILFFCSLLIITNSYAQELPCLKCHKTKSKGKDVHPAVEMGCDSCHLSPHEEEKPRLSLIAEPPDLCFNCHDKAMFTKRSQHPPVQAGMCTSCHNPHSSDNEKLLMAEPPELCYQCHDEGMFNKKVVHPALEMGCTMCHNPHSSDAEARMLVQDPPGLCFQCHDQSEFTAKSTIHPPVQAGMCTSCHNPHSQDKDKLLMAEPPELCFNCHDQGKFNNKYTHSPVEAGMCTSCHFPHQSDNEKLLQTAVPDLCFNCHDNAEFTRKNIHPALEMGCTTCHSPHASANIFQLLKPINGVCADCHPDIGKTPHVISGFGRGKGHPLMGKKDPARPGRAFACSSCHNPHSSDSIRLFRYRASSPFEICTNCHKF